MWNHLKQWLRKNRLDKSPRGILELNKHIEAVNEFEFGERLAAAPAYRGMTFTGDYQKAAKELVNRKLIREAEKKYPLTNKFNLTHPEVTRFAVAFINECRSRGIPMIAFETYRTPERQRKLKNKGVTNAPAGWSPHQYGCAVDLLVIPQWWEATRDQWSVLGVIGKEIARKKKIEITWGGDFESIYDPAHWEITNWRDYRKASIYAQKNSISLSNDTSQIFERLDGIIETVIRK
jgi:hypothetical protein